MVNPTPVTTSISKLGSQLLLTVPLAAPVSPTKEAAGLFVSPVSVSMALALLLNGAAKGSKVQGDLLELLAQGVKDASEVNNGFSAFLSTVKATNAPDAGLTVSIANSVWAKASSPFQPAYLALVKEHLNASAHALKNAKEVNDWCKTETRGKITEVVDEGAVRNADAILVNAVYFKGLWQNQFKKASTQKIPFTLQSGQVVDTPMMSKKFEGREAAFHMDNDFVAVKLPYRGDEFSAVVLLPTEGRTVQDVLTTVVAGSAKLPNGVGSLKWHSGDFFVFLPRFKIECEMKLKGVLSKLGVASIFSPTQDLSGLLQTHQPLVIDEVIHKVFIEVNEEGTEAAAVTAMMVRCCAALRTPEFRFDRPFVFTVVHNTTSTLLFAGIVSKPDTWADEGAPQASGGPPAGYPTS